MSEKKPIESDALQYGPSFKEMVNLIERLFKDSLEMTKAFTHDEIENGWQRYKTLNHLYQDDNSRQRPVWVKASNPDIKNGEYVAKYKAPGIKLKHDFVGMAFVDDQFVHFVCPCHYDLKWARGHEELQYAQILDESGTAPSGEREVAFAFTEWVNANFAGFYVGRELHHWYCPTLNGQEGRYTTAQLYELFKQKEKQ